MPTAPGRSIGPSNTTVPIAATPTIPSAGPGAVGDADEEVFERQRYRIEGQAVADDAETGDGA
jgi:hypothetical protein